MKQPNNNVYFYFLDINKIKHQLWIWLDKKQYNYNYYFFTLKQDKAAAMNLIGYEATTQL